MRSPVPFIAVRTGGLVLLDVGASSLGELLPSEGGALDGGGFSVEVLTSDLRSLTPFTAVLIGVPALIALTAGHSGTRPADSAAR